MRRFEEEADHNISEQKKKSNKIFPKEEIGKKKQNKERWMGKGNSYEKNQVVKNLVLPNQSVS